MISIIANITTIVANLIIISIASALGIGLYLRDKKRKEMLKSFER